MFLIKFEGETKLNLLNFIGEIYQKLWEDSQKVVEKIAEGDVSIYFYLVLGVGMVVLTITIRMLKKIKRIRKTFSGTDKEKENLEYLMKRKNGVEDWASGYLVIGICTTLISFLFFPMLAAVLLIGMLVIILPILLAIFLLGLLILGMKQIKETNDEINKLEKKVKKRNEKVKQNEKEDEND